MKMMMICLHLHRLHNMQQTHLEHSAMLSKVVGNNPNSNNPNNHDKHHSSPNQNSNNSHNPLKISSNLQEHSTLKTCVSLIKCGPGLKLLTV